MLVQLYTLVHRSSSGSGVSSQTLAARPARWKRTSPRSLRARTTRDTLAGSTRDSVASSRTPRLRPMRSPSRTLTTEELRSANGSAGRFRNLGGPPRTGSRSVRSTTKCGMSTRTAPARSTKLSPRARSSCLSLGAPSRMIHTTPQELGLGIDVPQGTNWRRSVCLAGPVSSTRDVDPSSLRTRAFGSKARLSSMSAWVSCGVLPIGIC